MLAGGCCAPARGVTSQEPGLQAPSLFRPSSDRCVPSYPFRARTAGSRMAKAERKVIGGVDTHADTHCVASLDSAGRLLGTREFPSDRAGCEQLLAWLRRHGQLTAVGVEGCGSYGAGLMRLLRERGVPVVEVRPSQPSGSAPSRQERPARRASRGPGGAGRCRRRHPEKPRRCRRGDPGTACYAQRSRQSPHCRSLSTYLCK